MENWKKWGTWIFSFYPNPAPSIKHCSSTIPANLGPTTLHCWCCHTIKFLCNFHWSESLGMLTNSSIVLNDNNPLVYFSPFNSSTHPWAVLSARMLLWCPSSLLSDTFICSVQVYCWQGGWLDKVWSNFIEYGGDKKRSGKYTIMEGRERCTCKWWLPWQSSLLLGESDYCVCLDDLTQISFNFYISQ